MKFTLPTFPLFHRDDVFRRARSILGKDHVATVHETRKIARVEQKIECGVPPYTQACLEACAEANTQGGAFYLLPKFGFSLFDQRTKVPKEFSEAVSTWHRNPDWINIPSEPGWLLVNLKPQWCDKCSMCHQESLKLDKHTTRVRIATVAEFAIVAKKKWNISHLASQFHMDEPTNSKVPLIGNYDDEGLLVYELALDAVCRFGFGEIGVVTCCVPGT